MAYGLFTDFITIYGQTYTEFVDSGFFVEQKHTRFFPIRNLLKALVSNVFKILVQNRFL